MSNNPKKRDTSHLDSDKDLQKKGDEDLEFEDPYIDEIEEEEIPEDDEMDVGEEEEEEKVETIVFKAGIDELKPDEELEFKNDAYTTIHRMRLEWPCLSFDIIRDDLGNNRTKFPITLYSVLSSQSGTDKNFLYINRYEELHKTQYDSDSDPDEPEGEEIYDDEPKMLTKKIFHDGDVNRVRCMPQNSSFVATWSSKKCVNIFNIGLFLKSLSTQTPLDIPQKAYQPIFSFKHQDEGFAMDWSTRVEGLFASGDMKKNIHIWVPRESKWDVSSALKGHTSSVEDIQWSPTQDNIFVSCSADKTIRIWDTRSRKEGLIFKASNSDVNVISWNKITNNLLVSGDDEGMLKVWDFKMMNAVAPKPTAQFKFHKDQISSVEWNPNDETMFAATSADDMTTIWDLSVERDPEHENSPDEVKEYPPQLLFVHMGQRNVKEVHWHPQIINLLLSTAETEAHIWKPSTL